MKLEKVKIINIVVAFDRNMIYGLGDDSMVYFWDANEHLWRLWG